MSLLRPARRIGADERLDAPDRCDPEVLERSLAQVAAVNRWLGGWRALRLHLPGLLPPRAGSRVLDVGTGGGEGALVLARWGRRTGRALTIVASDVHPRMLAIARRRTATFPEIRVEAADALELPYADGAFDLATLTLTLHHFDPERAVRVIRELARVARAVLVDDLDRGWPNYLGARVLAVTLWATNPLTRHDGPLSVLRAYTTGELLALARRAGRPEARVHRHAFQRLVLVIPSRVPARPG